MMKLRRRRGGRRVRAEMNVVPYIDVMLVLLVIFMIAAPLINQGIKVALPIAPGEPFTMPEGLPQGQLPLVITLDAQGNYSLNDGNGSPTKNAAEIVLQVKLMRQRYPELPVIIRGDKRVSYNELFSLVMALKNSGVDGIGMATSNGEDTP